MRSERKNMLIAVLLFVVLLMSAAFAAFSTNLTITSSTNVTTTWDVKIINIALKESTQSAANPYGTADSPATNPNSGATNPSYTDTTATFYSTLGAPGDSVTYVVTIQNSGTVNAVVDNIGWINDDGTADLQYNVSPIIYSYSFPNQSQTLAKNGGTTTLEVTVTYDTDVTDQPAESLLEKSATLSINYVQAA